MPKLFVFNRAPYKHLKKTFMQDKNHEQFFKVPLLLRTITVVGINDFLCVVFLARGTLYLLPDGRRLNEGWWGRKGFSVIRIAFLITTHSWDSGVCIKLIILLA